MVREFGGNVNLEGVRAIAPPLPCARAERPPSRPGVHSTSTTPKPNTHRLEANGFSSPSVFPAEKAVVLGEQVVMQ